MLVRRSMAALTFVLSVQAQYLATVVAGGGGLTAAANNVRATSVPLGPTGLAVDPAGNVYVTNGGPSVLLKISSGGILAIAAGTPSALGMSGDDGPATSAELNDPSG